MIKAKITSKAGTSFEWELPTNIHELHHALTEMGIRKTPRSLLLMDDNAANVELTADSEIGSGLLRVFSKGDTLADANTVAFAVSAAREEILPELEQNILHDQYPTKEMLFDDIKVMTQAAGPVKLTFYCPLVGQLDDGECDEYIDVGSGFLAAYQDQIEQGIANEQAPEMGDDGEDTTRTLMNNMSFRLCRGVWRKAKLPKVCACWRDRQTSVRSLDSGGNGWQAPGPYRLPSQGAAPARRNGRFAGRNPWTIFRLVSISSITYILLLNL